MLKVLKILGISFVAVILLGFLVWGLLYFRNKTDWNKRVNEANQSEIYSGRTNGIYNETLIAVAREYINSGSESIYLNNVSIKETDAELIKIGWGADWINKHAPEGVFYNTPGKFPSPYEYLNDKYSVYWLFMPGCEKRLEDKISNPNWYDKNGNHCFGGYGVSILINNKMKAERLDISALH